MFAAALCITCMQRTLIRLLTHVDINIDVMSIYPDRCILPWYDACVYKLYSIRDCLINEVCVRRYLMMMMCVAGCGWCDKQEGGDNDDMIWQDKWVVGTRAEGTSTGLVCTCYFFFNYDHDKDSDVHTYIQYCMHLKDNVHVTSCV